MEKIINGVQLRTNYFLTNEIKRLDTLGLLIDSFFDFLIENKSAYKEDEAFYFVDKIEGAKGIFTTILGNGTEELTSIKESFLQLIQEVQNEADNEAKTPKERG